MLKSKFTQLLVVIILITGWLFYFYHDLILSPNNYLTADWGDGVKAYAVFIGHIKNDSTYTNYQNMNYPYGQTHIFTDGQTGIANTFKFFANYSSFFLDNAIGLYNLLMIFSYVGCAIFLFLIIKRLNMPPLFTILGSICITVLSPQIFRITGHLTLSYVVFFPLSWWLLIKFTENKKKILYSIFIILNSVFWFFVHPYYVMIISIFYASWWLISVLQDKNQRIKSNLLHFLLQVIVPLAITRLYVLAVDTHTFRSESPWGFWESYARWDTVFMPSHAPFGAILKSILFPLSDQNWEGRAYIGLPSVIIAGFSIFKIVRYLFRKKYCLVFKPALPNILRVSVWASFFVLLFSMCYPFQLGMPFLVDWMPVLKQFRSLGRFAWVFYYVFTVYSLYVMYLTYRYFKLKDYRALAFCFPLLFFFFYLLESKPHHEEVSKQIHGGSNYFNLTSVANDYLEIIQKVNLIKKEYQCIIPLPFYHVGSENFSKEFTNKSLLSSLVISFWTNFPLLASSSARSPIVEAKNILQIFSPSYFRKEIEKDLPNKKPFLILYSKESLNKTEEEWLLTSKSIFENKSFELLKLNYEDVFKSNTKQLVAQFKNEKDSLIVFDKFLCTSMPDTIVYKNYDNIVSPITFRGNGCWSGQKKEINILLEKGKYNLKNNQDYLLSFWYYNKDELRTQAYCAIEECDSEGNNAKWDIIFTPGESMIIDGDWSLIEKKIRLKNNDEQITIFLYGENDSNQEMFVDDLMIRPLNVNVYKELTNTNKIFKNTIEIFRR